MSRLEVRLNRPLPYVNALRRCILAMIPHAAVDNVQVEVNTTVHNDSFLIKTLEMLPMFDAPALALDCILDVTCDDDIVPVTSSSLQVLLGDAAWIKPAVFLFHLQRGQRVRLRLKNSRGTPTTHVRYQVAHAGYRIVPTIALKPGVALADVKDLCCRQVFDVGIDATKCIACGDCYDHVQVTATNDVVFFIDSNAEDAMVIYKWALRVLQEQVSLVLQATPVFHDDGIIPDTRVWVTDMPMTVAQLLVYEVSQQGATFHAVRLLHPLQSTLSIRIGAPDVAATFQEAILSCLETLQAWQDSI